LLEKAVNSEKLLREEFSRNIGLLTENEQKKLFAARVAVAGAGGVGGLHILTLARMGIGSFKIADPDVFEVVNVSRQFGASAGTFGKNKAEIFSQMVKDINPYADVKVFTEGVNESNVDSFLKDIDIFIDGIDFFEIDARRLIFNRAREKGIYAITAAPIGFGATLQVFSPKGMTFDEYFGINDDLDTMHKVAAFATGLTPRLYHIRYLDLSKVDLKKKTGPALSLACTLAASFVATEVVKILVGKGDIKSVPHYLQIDLLRGKFKQGYLFMGGRNPFQRLKRWLILKKASSAE
jgi:molybdopterin/thiamine biosynthesis adenylyltransferase